MTRPVTSSRSIVVRMVGAALTIIVMAAVLLALFALSSCDAPPDRCPPPFGCKR